MSPPPSPPIRRSSAFFFVLLRSSHIFLSASLGRPPTQQSLIDPGRVFIREAQLLGWNVKNKRKQIYVVFLFNDLLVLARPMKVCTACFVCAVCVVRVALALPPC